MVPGGTGVVAVSEGVLGGGGGSVFDAVLGVGESSAGGGDGSRAGLHSGLPGSGGDVHEFDAGQVAAEASGSLGGGHADGSVGLVRNVLGGVVHHAGASPATLGTGEEPVELQGDGGLVAIGVGADGGGESRGCGGAGEEELGFRAVVLLDAVGERVREGGNGLGELVSASASGGVAGGGRRDGAASGDVGQLNTGAVGKRKDVRPALVGGGDGGVVPCRGDMRTQHSARSPRATDRIAGRVVVGIGSIPNDGTVPLKDDGQLSPGQVPGVIEAASVLGGGQERVGRATRGDGGGVVVDALADSCHAGEEEARGTSRGGGVVDVFPGSVAEVRLNASAVDFDVLIIGRSLRETLELGNTSGR